MRTENDLRSAMDRLALHAPSEDRVRAALQEAPRRSGHGSFSQQGARWLRPAAAAVAVLAVAALVAVGVSESGRSSDRQQTAIGASPSSSAPVQTTPPPPAVSSAPPPPPITIHPPRPTHRAAPDTTSTQTAQGCGHEPGRIITFTLDQGTVTPNCVIVTGRQRIRIVNDMIKVLHGAAHQARISARGLPSVTLKVRQAVLYDRPIGQLFKPGQHFIHGRRFSFIIWLRNG